MFVQIISKRNLFAAWREFRKCKKNKKDVRRFAFNLEENLIALHEELKTSLYVHGPYHDFFLCDPKLRHIHKASVRDRIVHHAIHRVLYSIFDSAFIFDSFSSRIGKGTHAAVKRFEDLAWRESANNTRGVWVLKCDVRKFFDSIDHNILLKILADKIKDERLLKLLREIIKSFCKNPDKGLPLGNLTSQLLANAYLDKLDNFIKRKLRIKGYVRYADDLLCISRNRLDLEILCMGISDFLRTNLELELHPAKTLIRKWSTGIDVLGYTSFPHHRLLRTKTKNRAFGRVNYANVSSYLSLLKHCLGHGIYKLLTPPN